MKKLKKYMHENKETLKGFARKIGCTHASVHGWVNGNAKPSVSFAIRIEEITRGAVTVYDWR